jgi:tetratricopeptide (TPR) repeat protein
VQLSGLRGKLAVSDRRAVWSALAALCAGLDLVDRSGRWAARRGFALRRAGRMPESTEAYAGAVRSRATAQHLAGLAAALDHQERWLEAAEAFRSARMAADGTGWLQEEARCRRKALDWGGLASLSKAVLDHRPDDGSWWFELGSALERLDEFDDARAALRRAVAAQEPRPSWFVKLARIERITGSVVAADTAFRAADERGGLSAAARRDWAEMLTRSGRWGQAAALLRVNVEASDDDATSRWRLGETLLEWTRWGGTLRGPLAEPGRFVSDATPSLSPYAALAGQDERLALACRSLEEAVALRPKRVGWKARLGEIYELRGDYDSAIESFNQAVEATRHSDAGWAFRVKHPWQFKLERAYHLAGRGRVVDPLFDCRVRTPEASPSEDSSDVPVGLFRVRVNHTSLVIEGFLQGRDDDHVELLLNGRLLRSVNVSREDGYPRFAISLKRETVELLPQESCFEMRTGIGEAVWAPMGGQSVEVDVPHGSDALFSVLDAGSKLDKKGEISPSTEDIYAHQQRYLDLYAEVRDVLEKQCGIGLFLMYGTLLGCIRDGELIPGDDDFDAGYVSDLMDPVAVKEETKSIIRTLLRAGYTVTFNRRGRLFRAQRERSGGAGLHLDLRPIWFEDGRVWVHNHASFPSSRDDFLPLERRKLRNVEVLVPRRAEVFLHGHYGPGWRVPDPGFTYYASDIDPEIREHLGRALITPAEFRAMEAEVLAEAQQNQALGRFVSIGSQELYPLHDFIE